ncbi:hypothetical protein [Leifsonia sp. Le1]|uniref:hypothetical protein n=1 Tax=Leifsonia sp. Le1 TaxID=3404918 RepID=UPI003EB6F416
MAITSVVDPRTAYAAPAFSAPPGSRGEERRVRLQPPALQRGGLHLPDARLQLVHLRAVDDRLGDGGC